MNKSKIKISLACILQQHERNEMSRKVLVFVPAYISNASADELIMKCSWNVTLPTSPVRFHVCGTSGSRLQTERGFLRSRWVLLRLLLNMCVFIDTLAATCRCLSEWWMCPQSVGGTANCYQPPICPRPIIHPPKLPVWLPRKAQSTHMCLHSAFYPEKAARQQTEPQRSEVTHNVPTEKQNYY